MLLSSASQQRVWLVDYKLRNRNTFRKTSKYLLKTVNNRNDYLALRIRMSLKGTACCVYFEKSMLLDWKMSGFYSSRFKRTHLQRPEAKLANRTVVSVISTFPFSSIYIPLAKAISLQFARNFYAICNGSKQLHLSYPLCPMAIERHQWLFIDANQSR